MSKRLLVIGLLLLTIVSASFTGTPSNNYINYYQGRINSFRAAQQQLASIIKGSPLASPGDINKVRDAIYTARLEMKKADFWMRYMEPLAYKKNKCAIACRVGNGSI